MSNSFNIERSWTDSLGRQHYQIVEDVVPTIVVYEVGREPQKDEFGNRSDQQPGNSRRDDFGRMSDMLDAMLYSFNAEFTRNSREWWL